MNRLTRRDMIQCGLAGIGSIAAGDSALGRDCVLAIGEHSFHRDHVIGTSLDGWINAESTAVAEAAERAILDEIERLRLVFSTFDPASELSWLNRSPGPLAVSNELLEVLRAYDTWSERSEGALTARLGELVRVWRDAEAAGREPDAATVARLVQQTSLPAWTIKNACGAVTRLTDQPLNLNSIAKGYILDRACDAARAKGPETAGLLLNLGGDLRGWQDNGAGWLIGVQNPFLPQDNAIPWTVLQIKGGAIATSGGYLRGYQLGSRWFSHLLDPRTGRPAGGVASATVIAPDSATANALATTLCVLSPERGLRLIGETPLTECLIIAADGRAFHSLGWRSLEVPLTPPAESTSACMMLDAEQQWPAQFQLAISIELPKITSNKYRRPYVAVWIENADGSPVRSISVWGNEQKYLKDLSQWWKFAKGNQDVVKTVTRATRAPGKYDVVWDGMDDKGEAVPQGTYTVRVEVHREHGQHLTQTGKIRCGAEPAKATLEKNAETGVTVVAYGKKK